MATEHLKLRKCKDGYYRCQWVDNKGQPHQRSFGRNRNEAYNRFNVFHTKWQRDPAIRNPEDGGPLTIAGAWTKYKAFADSYYRKPDGTPSGEATNIEHAFNPVVQMFCESPASEFGPKALKQVREQMVLDDLCLNVINQRIRKIRQVFKWLVSEELIAPDVWHGLQAVEALKAGKSEARVTDQTRPVPEAHIWETIKHVTPTVEAMIMVQFYTGMRPGAVCAMRPVDLDMGGKVWVYSSAVKRPQPIPIGPKAQRYIEPFLQRDVTAFLFSPRESLHQKWSQCETHRHQPVEAPKTTRRVDTHYTPQAYGYYIRRICRNHKIPHWSPNQLRHNALTRLRQQFGLDVAQVIGGHAKADTTEIYAELDLKKAISIMEKVG